MAKTALIIGSTGMVGKLLLDLLLNGKDYDRVISFVRHATGKSHPKLHEHVIDFDKIDSYCNLIKGDDLFCCLGTTIKKAGSQEAFRKVDYTYPTIFAKLAADNGVQQFLMITSIGANSGSRNFYLRTKGECERFLTGLHLRTVFIFRPSLLIGKREEYRRGENTSIYLMKIFSRLLFGKMKKYRSIDAEKVAYAMYASAQHNKEGYFIIESDGISDIFARRNI